MTKVAIIISRNYQSSVTKQFIFMLAFIHTYVYEHMQHLGGIKLWNPIK